ncbi:MAG: AmmeMemoRadiSam system protein A [gamma proteobacterium symbiont of Taylorina sp.]|nr:AmmeMemoRadiSam system protein A [gamma proteobacterium symbiont of Taylorina sp.]
MYSQTERDLLHKIARDSILSGLEQGTPLTIKASDYPEVLQKKQASFVTLNINHNLRGCIGTLSAYRSLVDDIAHNAHAAAFSDPRFPALTVHEYQQLDYHISVLSDTSPMQFSSEQDLLTQIRPQIDGLILEDNGRRGTFLPSVWEQLPKTEDFWTHLKHKAGLSADHWSKTLQVNRYTVESF